MPRVVFSLTVALFSLLAACGLSERERAVSQVNEGILAADTTGRVVADLIAQIPAEEAVGADDIASLRDALSQYMGAMEVLNAAMRTLGTRVEPLREHLETAFRPAAEAAASSCQQALDTLSSPAPSPDEYQRALTRIGQCIDRYAAAISNVTAAHERAAR
ncbi:MAG: phage shock protein A [Bradymonadia bacterium]|jgi:phage shock protein A